MQMERRAQRLERSCLSLPPQPQPCGTGTGRHTVICRLAVLRARHTLLLERVLGAGARLWPGGFLEQHPSIYVLVNWILCSETEGWG